jgi:hypothetical protein
LHVHIQAPYTKSRTEEQKEKVEKINNSSHLSREGERRAETISIAYKSRVK